MQPARSRPVLACLPFKQAPGGTLDRSGSPRNFGLPSYREARGKKPPEAPSCDLPLYRVVTVSNMVAFPSTFSVRNWLELKQRFGE